MNKWPEVTPEYLPEEPPIMPVMYDENYKNALANLAFAADKNEISERVFALTTYVLEKNPHHYTSLTLRRRYIRLQIRKLQGQLEKRGFALKQFEANQPLFAYADAKVQQRYEAQYDVKSQRDMAVPVEEEDKVVVAAERALLAKEFELINAKIINQELHKNFQLWNHKNELVSVATKLGFSDITLAQLDECEEILKLDEKNYHCYDFMCFAIKQFIGIPDVSFLEAPETPYTLTPESLALLNKVLERQKKKIVEMDIRNNSYYALAMFAVTILARSNSAGFDAEGIVDFAKMAIKKAAQNESSWAMLQGLYELLRETHPAVVGGVKDFVLNYACFDSETIVSPHAVHLRIKMMRDGVKFTETDAADCVQLCKEIAMVDSIHRKYWEYAAEQVPRQ